MMLHDQIICMNEVKEIYLPQIKILALKRWYLQEINKPWQTLWIGTLIYSYHHVHAEHSTTIVPLAYSVLFYVHVVLTPTKKEIPTTSALCA